MKKEKKWLVSVLVTVFIALIMLAVPTFYIDPYFHYHSPNPNFSYIIDNERYQNDGISRNFSYDAIITGTSMTENFKTSECDELFGVKSIKVPFSGASYKEVNENLERAFETNGNIKVVIRCLDQYMLADEQDRMRYSEYPDYLTNNNPFDDVKYVLNKNVLALDKGIISYTKAGNTTTSFDDYANWNNNFTYGIEPVMATYDTYVNVGRSTGMNESDINNLKENIYQNVTKLAEEHPETVFYLFLPPYSICSWDNIQQSGKMKWTIEAEKYAIEELLKYDNIKVFSFSNNFELTSNLDNYKDIYHFGEWINSDILYWMSNGQYMITKDNYKQYLSEIDNHYSNYDYASLRKY